MERSTSVRQYVFTTGSLIADANGNLSTYTNQSINGTIQKIFFDAGNWTATGSLQIFESGANLTPLWAIISGTATSHVRADQLIYPFVYGTNNGNITGSPQVFFLPVVNGPIQLIGSGLANGASGLSLQIFYI